MVRILGKAEPLGDRLAAQKGVGPGFDALRIGLALLIFYGHTMWISGAGLPPGGEAAQVATAMGELPVGGAAWEGWKRPRYAALVPMFFALSGFLVAGSAFRTRNVREFLTLRVLRIVPALATEVALSALILGPLLTSLALGAYLTDPAFAAYFGNIVGLVTFHLPGLFLANPIPGIVNVNLWTLPAEFYCYLVLGFLIFSGLFFRRGPMTAIFLAVTPVLAALNWFTDFAVTPQTAAGHVLVYYFAVGFLFFLWRDRIPLHPALFVLASVAAWLLLLSRHTVYLAPVFLTYATVYVGMLRLPRLPLLQRGDYSYGIYLYGFPIAQAVMAICPEWRGQSLLVLAVSTAATAVFAVFSWHVIEKPTLALRKTLIPRAPAPPQAAAKHPG